MQVLGMCHVAGGIAPGKVVELDDEKAERLIASGHVRRIDDLRDVDPELADLAELKLSPLGQASTQANDEATTTVVTGTIGATATANTNPGASDEDA